MSTRKNGKQASCEPCRKAKIRCDHQEPCGRCRMRRIETRCWYHPAPLTKPRSTGDAQDPAQIELSTPRSQSSLAWTPATRGPPQPMWPGTGPEGGPSLLPSDADVLCSTNLDAVAEMLSHLSHLEVMEKLINKYYTEAQAALVPERLTVQLLNFIRNNPLIPLDVLENRTADQQSLRYAAGSVLRYSATKVVVNPEMDMEQFCALFSKNNIRLEALGLLFTLAARACLYEVFGDGEDYKQLAQVMYHHGMTCLDLARKLSPEPSDLIVWLGYEEVQVSTLVDGDAHLSGWRRMNSLAGDIFTLGYHRETFGSNSNAPFWLREMKKRAFVYSFRQDKSFSALLERPPQIPAYFCKTEPPLDLTDDEMFAEPAELEHALSLLRPDGWSTVEKIKSATWARMRHMISTFADELVAHMYRPLKDDDESKLIEMDIQCRQKWDAFPAYVHYWPECWDTLPPSVCFMMGKVYISQLSIGLRIHWLLHRKNPDRGISSALVRVAMTELETVMQMANQRDRAIFIRRDLPALFPGYGSMPATILATALLESSRNPAYQLPLNFDRAKTIRNLSVFVSLLQGVCGPGRLNHSFCAPGAEAISRMLDEVLGSSSPAPARAPITPMSDASTPSVTQTVAEIPGLDTDMLRQGVDPLDWTFSIDWNSSDMWAYTI